MSAQEPAAEAAPRWLALWLPPVLYLAAIFWLSSQPQPVLALPSWAGADKVAHAAAYAGLGVLLCRAYGASGVSASAALALAVLTASLYGASDEWHQSFVPNRMADARDWLADTAGAISGAAAWLLALRVLRAQASIR